jgi:hypothetical protein
VADDKQEIEYSYHPLMKDSEDNIDKTNLSFLEMVGQAFSLIFAVQRGSGLKRATDLLEKNPKSVILAGFISMAIFFGIAFSISQLLIHLFSA